MACKRCVEELRLPEGTLILTPDQVTAQIGENGQVIESTMRKASGASSFAEVLKTLANERTPSGGLPIGASEPRILR